MSYGLTSEQKRERLCQCHQFQEPCTWCLSLTEDEMDAFVSGGREAVNAILDRKIEMEEGNEEQFVEAIQRAFFGNVQVYGSGRGGEVTQCNLCQGWTSATATKMFFHLRAMHGFSPSDEVMRIAESMAALGADPKEIARQLGARV